MNKFIIAGFLLVFLSGCAFAREITLRVDGDNIKSPYATGDARIIMHKITSYCVGADHCKQAAKMVKSLSNPSLMNEMDIIEEVNHE